MESLDNGIKFEVIYKWIIGIGQISVVVVGFFIMGWMSRVEEAMEKNSIIVSQIQTTLIELTFKSQSISDETKSLKLEITKQNEKIYQLVKDNAELEKRLSLIEANK